MAGGTIGQTAVPARPLRLVGDPRRRAAQQDEGGAAVRGRGQLGVVPQDSAIWL